MIFFPGMWIFDEEYFPNIIFYVEVIIKYIIMKKEERREKIGDTLYKTYNLINLSS